MRLNERGEMPKETIAATLVDNGEDGAYANTLKISWGPKGGAPEAPDGWVNAGYAQLVIDQSDESGLPAYVILGEDDVARLLRTLKKVRRRAFRETDYGVGEISR
jgi:hypothetical protein